MDPKWLTQFMWVLQSTANGAISTYWKGLFHISQTAGERKDKDLRKGNWMISTALTDSTQQSSDFKHCSPYAHFKSRLSLLTTCTHITEYTKIAICLVCLISALHGSLLIDTVYTISLLLRWVLLERKGASLQRCSHFQVHVQKQS